MTQEDRELLLKDLCARLPHKLCVEDEYGDIVCLDYTNLHFENYFNAILEGNVKPYLFPLSSMTEEQYKYISYNFGRDGLDYIKYGTCDFHSSTLNIEDIYELVDWLNKNQFDYRGLIPKGLVLDATGKNIY